MDSTRGLRKGRSSIGVPLLIRDVAGHLLRLPPRETLRRPDSVSPVLPLPPPPPRLPLSPFLLSRRIFPVRQIIEVVPENHLQVELHSLSAHRCLDSPVGSRLAVHVVGPVAHPELLVEGGVLVAHVGHAAPLGVAQVEDHAVELEVGVEPDRSAAAVEGEGRVGELFPSLHLRIKCRHS